MLDLKARIVPKNYRNVTGKKASTKANDALFESTLERDFLTVIEFDHSVSLFDVQPVTIHWIDKEGKSRKYTPDVLVFFKKNDDGTPSKVPELCEIKYRSELKEHWHELRPKFKAAVKYAKQHGWRFRLVTDVEIRTSYMDNAKFLLPYLHREQKSPYLLLIQRKLLELRETSIQALITSIFSDKWAQAELIPIVWQLIALRKVGVDFNIPLTMDSRIWSK